MLAYAIALASTAQLLCYVRIWWGFSLLPNVVFFVVPAVLSMVVSCGLITDFFVLMPVHTWVSVPIVSSDNGAL